MKTRRVITIYCILFLLFSTIITLVLVQNSNLKTKNSNMEKALEARKRIKPILLVCNDSEYIKTVEDSMSDVLEIFGALLGFPQKPTKIEKLERGEMPYSPITIIIHNKEALIVYPDEINISHSLFIQHIGEKILDKGLVTKGMAVSMDLINQEDIRSNFPIDVLKAKMDLGFIGGYDKMFKKASQETILDPEIVEYAKMLGIRNNPTEDYERMVEKAEKILGIP